MCSHCVGTILPSWNYLSISILVVLIVNISALQTLSLSLFQVMAAASRLCSSTLAQYGESRAKSFASRTIRHGERRSKENGETPGQCSQCGQKSKCHTNVAKTAHCRLVLSSPSIFEVWLLQGYLHVLLTKSRSSCCDKGCHSIHASTG